MGWYRELYDIEDRARRMSDEQRLELCQAEAKPIWDAMRAELADIRSRTQQVVLPKSELRKALTYLQNHWAELTRYLEDPQLPIDNNLCERLMRQVAVGRNNWLFAGNVLGGERSAGFMTLVSSAHRADLNLQAYVEDVLRRLLAGDTDYASMLPWVWAEAHPESVLTFRQDERQQRDARRTENRAARRAHQQARPVTPHRPTSRPPPAASCRFAPVPISRGSPACRVRRCAPRRSGAHPAVGRLRIAEVLFPPDIDGATVMSHKLFSFLGTGRYFEAVYQLEGKSASPSKFIQRALIELQVAGPQPEVYFLLTKEARDMHWAALEQELQDLQSRTEFQYIAVDVPTGSDMDTVWAIHDSIADKVDQGDTLSLDITHAFRFLPLLMSQLCQYLRHTKQVELGRIWYGNVEAMYRQHDASPRDLAEKVPDPQDRNAPIEDLSSLLTLNLWTEAIAAFGRFGDAEQLASLANSGISPVLSQSKGQNEEATKFREIVKLLKQHVEACHLCRGAAIAKIDYPRLSELCREVSGAFVPAMRPLLVSLSETFADWESGSPRNVIRAARWCERRSMNQQAYTLLQEGIVSVVEHGQREVLNRIKAPNCKDGKRSRVLRRSVISSLLNCLGKKYPPEKWSGPLVDWKAEAEAIASEIPESAAAMYDTITDRRNDVNHAGFTPDATTAAKLVNALSQHLNVAEREFLAGISLDEQGGVKANTATVIYSVGVDDPIAPNEPLPPLPEIPRGSVVVVEGRAPIWRYGMAFHALHGSSAAAIAFYDPRLGAVVVASHHPDYHEGQVLEVKL